MTAMLSFYEGICTDCGRLRLIDRESLLCGDCGLEALPTIAASIKAGIQARCCDSPDVDWYDNDGVEDSYRCGSILGAGGRVMRRAK